MSVRVRGPAVLCSTPVLPPPGAYSSPADGYLAYSSPLRTLGYSSPGLSFPATACEQPVLKVQHQEEPRPLLSLWRYQPPDGRGVDIRATADINGLRTTEELVDGAVFGVSEEIPGNDGVLYLRLANGKGWLFDRKPGLGTMCVRAGSPRGSEEPPSSPPVAAVMAAALNSSHVNQSQQNLQHHQQHQQQQQQQQQYYQHYQQYQQYAQPPYTQSMSQLPPYQQSQYQQSMSQYQQQPYQPPPSAASFHQPPPQPPPYQLPMQQPQQPSAASGVKQESVAPYGEDSPGSYLIVHNNARVTSSADRGQSTHVIAQLQAGTIVNVLEVKHIPHDTRVRARIENPPGWMTLVHGETGYRWAVKQNR